MSAKGLALGSSVGTFTHCVAVSARGSVVLQCGLRHVLLLQTAREYIAYALGVQGTGLYIRRVS